MTYFVSGDLMRRAVPVLFFWLIIATPIASSAQAVTKVADFLGSNGGGPLAPLIQATDGNLYGTTPVGGVGYGTVFKMTPEGTITLLHSFNLTDGGTPFAGLVQGSDGNFYGTTSTGGPTGHGTVFKITRESTLTTLYSFCAQQECPDGSGNARLIQATDGNFYGTTPGGGYYNAGTVFKMSLQGQLSTLHSFNVSDGMGPVGLVQATDGNFYGTTPQGAKGYGTVYRITPDGTLTTLHVFCDKGICGSEGTIPNGGLMQAADGNFYGTTSRGGAEGVGTVFAMTPEGAFTTLHSFCLRCGDGSIPSDGLAQATDGDLYGVTTIGGLSNDGTLFKITAQGTLTTLYSFCSQPGCSDGYQPNAALAQSTDGSLYGTTMKGGWGTVFKVAAPLLDQLSVAKHGSGIVTSSDNNINCGDVCSHDYDRNAQVTLTANPSSGWLYDSWYGCDNLSGNVCTVTMNKLRTVTANFAPTYPLTVAKVGNGTVASADGHILCGPTCSYTYRIYTDVTLAATPDPGWIFTSWSGCDNVNGDVCTLTMYSPRTVTATFTGAYQLTVSKSGNGSVVSGDGHINCGPTCSYTYLSGTPVTLTASPDQGWMVSGWAGCDSTQGNICSVTVKSDHQSVAVYMVQVPLHTLSVNKSGSGLVSSGDGHIYCGNFCSNQYFEGTQVYLTAVPAAGYTLASWAGCSSVQGNVCIARMSNDRFVSANFTQPPVKLNSLALQPSSVKGGNISIATVTLDHAAPAGGFGVGLSSDHPTLVMPPAFVTVPAGSTSVSFAVRTTPVRAKTVANITASANNSQKSATLTLTTGYTTSQATAQKSAPQNNRSTKNKANLYNGQ